jgi:putative ABC transport system permease protein
MAIPLIYNVRSLAARWSSTVVAVLGIAGTVGVFIAMLALARGFQATLVKSGSAQNALIRRAGATSEMDSGLTIDQVRVVEDAPGVQRTAIGVLASSEVVVIAALPLKGGGTEGNAQVRGVSPKALAVRPSVRMVAGRFFRPGLNELVIGRNVESSYAGIGMGATVRFGGSHWTVVGVFDSGGTAFDSELWSDANVLKQTFQRPLNLFQSVTVRLESPAAFGAFKNSLTADPRLTVQVDREVDYYTKQSRQLTTLITVLGMIIAFVMGIGAVFAALNTMYSAVAERAREIATLRSLGFDGASVVVSFVVEALCIALLGGIIGCLAVLPLNGLTTGTINWQTFSHLAFAFRVTPLLFLWGLGFALLMGIVGGVPPAVRAARAPIATALREL